MKLKVWYSKTIQITLAIQDSILKLTALFGTAEYGDKYGKPTTSKIANMWERRIGSDVVHDASPSSVVKSSGSEVSRGPNLTSAGSQKAFGRKNTIEIVKGKLRLESSQATNRKEGLTSDTKEFERMASFHKQQSLSKPGSIARKIGSSLSTVKSDNSNTDFSKEEIKNIIQRIRSRMSEVDKDLNTLNALIAKQ